MVSALSSAEFASQQYHQICAAETSQTASAATNLIENTK